MKKKIYDFRVNNDYNYGVLALDKNNALKLLVEKLLNDNILYLEEESFEIELISEDVLLPTEENPVVVYEER